jgi:hypothetical protein
MRTLDDPVSASNAGRDRNSQINAPQTDLQSSPIDQTINRFAHVGHLFWVCRRDKASKR